MYVFSGHQEGLGLWFNQPINLTRDNSANKRCSIRVVSHLFCTMYFCLCNYLRMQVSNTISILNEFTPGVRVARCLIFCVVFCRSLFIMLSIFLFGHCVVFSFFDNGFWLPPFAIIKLFLLLHQGQDLCLEVRGAQRRVCFP